MQKIYCDICGREIPDCDEAVRFSSDADIGGHIRVSQNIDMCKRCYFRIVDRLEKHEPLKGIGKEN